MLPSCYRPDSLNENSLWPKLDDHLRRRLTTEFFFLNFCPVWKSIFISVDYQDGADVSCIAKRKPKQQALFDLYFT